LIKTAEKLTLSIKNNMSISKEIVINLTKYQIAL